MELGLAGKRAIVTGATRGIGRAVDPALERHRVTHVHGCADDLRTALQRADGLINRRLVAGADGE